MKKIVLMALLVLGIMVALPNKAHAWVLPNDCVIAPESCVIVENGAASDISGAMAEADFEYYNNNGNWCATFENELRIAHAVMLVQYFIYGAATDPDFWIAAESYWEAIVTYVTWTYCYDPNPFGY